MSESLRVFATLLLDRGLEVVFALLSVLFMRVVLYGAQFLRARLSDANWQRLKAITREVVLAMEQSKLKEGAITEAKVIKQQAVMKLQARLREVGLNTFADNVDLLSNTIEATVYDEFNRTWPTIEGELAALQG